MVGGDSEVPRREVVQELKNMESQGTSTTYQKEQKGFQYIPCSTPSCGSGLRYRLSHLYWLGHVDGPHVSHCIRCSG